MKLGGRKWGQRKVLWRKFFKQHIICTKMFFWHKISHHGNRSDTCSGPGICTSVFFSCLLSLVCLLSAVCAAEYCDNWVIGEIHRRISCHEICTTYSKPSAPNSSAQNYPPLKMHQTYLMCPCTPWTNSWRGVGGIKCTQHNHDLIINILLQTPNT